MNFILTDYRLPINIIIVIALDLGLMHRVFGLSKLSALPWFSVGGLLFGTIVLGTLFYYTIYNLNRINIEMHKEMHTRLSLVKERCKMQ